MPIFAIFLVKMLFGFSDPRFEVVKDTANKYCLAMLMIAVAAFITGSIQKWLFGIVGETIAKKMRIELYKSFLSKH